MDKAAMFHPNPQMRRMREMNMEQEGDATSAPTQSDAHSMHVYMHDDGTAHTHIHHKDGHHEHMDHDSHEEAMDHMQRACSGEEPDGDEMEPTGE